MPESVTFSGDNMETDEFDYNIFLPEDVWYGYKCRTSTYSPAYSPAPAIAPPSPADNVPDSFPTGSFTDLCQHSSWKWFEYVMLGLLLSVL